MTPQDTIVVLDDDADFADMVGEFLRDRGHSVRVAHSGREGLGLLADSETALLLLDLQLPDMSGGQVMERARDLAHAPEVVIVTGHAGLDSAVEAVEGGVGGYLVKPVALDRLGAIVDRILDRRRLRRDNERLSAESANRLRETEALLAISSTISSTLDVREALRRVCRELTRLIGADSGAVYLHEAASDHLVAFAGYRVPRELLATFLSTPLPLREQGFHVPLWRDRRPVFSDDVASDPRFGHDLFRRHHHQSGLVLPLILDGEVAGAFYLVWWTARPSLSERELTLATSAADQVTVLLHNARLFEEASAQQARFAQILDAASDGIMLLSPGGQVETANRRAGELLVFSPARAGGLGITELLAGHFRSGADYLKAVTELRSLLDEPEHGGEGDLELPAVKRVVHWVARPTPGPGGRTLGFTLTLHDVTREREVSRMKSDFVSFVTHQLRTPLAGIRWMVELAAKEPGVPVDAGSYLEDAQRAAERLIGLVNDLLDISRLEHGTLAISLRAADLAELTRRVLDEVAPLVKDQGHRVAVIAAEDVPPVVADPQLLGQVVQNLVSNAIKYTPAGGEVAISMARQGDSVVWSVRDSGVGVPAAAQHRLFEKFFRADNVLMMETEGTGLGLYFVRLIMERLGGRVWCESEEGRGATFAFALPAARIGEA